MLAYNTCTVILLKTETFEVDVNEAQDLAVCITGNEIYTTYMHMRSNIIWNITFTSYCVTFDTHLLKCLAQNAGYVILWRLRRTVCLVQGMWAPCSSLSCIHCRNYMGLGLYYWRELQQFFLCALSRLFRIVFLVVWSVISFSGVCYRTWEQRTVFSFCVALQSTSLQ